MQDGPVQRCVCGHPEACACGSQATDADDQGADD